MTPREPGGGSESLIARCIEALETDGPAAVDRILADHPDEAPAIRKRLGTLGGLGLLRPSREEPPPPEQIGPYRILREVGEGGMGTVYLAEQHKPVARRVALKLVKVGLDTRAVMARFDAERQALALMSHPNIACVFDAGATEQGRPYFVMEYVPGVAITRYCDEQHLTLEERLRLFLPVCEAVQHAHHKGIIHRDLKPSNVLVSVQDGRPVPKIIDFGVAKATNKRLTEAPFATEQGMILGTPEYMSPEQAARDVHDVDTRSDVYSLGVMLYELLTGGLPFEARKLREAGYGGMQRIIREARPPTPSLRVTTPGQEAEAAARARGTDVRTLGRRLRGDLDWITLRALEKDRDRRYGTPLELAADVRRHLAREPVLAGPPGRLYRLGKYLRRHREAAAVSVLLVAALIVGVVSTTVVYLRGEASRREAEWKAELEGEKRRQAERQAERGFTLNNWFAGLFARGAGRPDLRVKDLIDQAAESMETGFFEPVVEAEIQSKLGNILSTMQEFGEADKHLRRALALRRRTLGPLHPKTVGSLIGLARSLCERGRHPEAEQLLRPALNELAGARGEEDPSTSRLKEFLGYALYGQHKTEEARKLLGQVLESRSIYRDPRYPAALARRARLYLLVGRLENAREDLDRAVALAPRSCDARFNRAIVEVKLGHYDQAEADLRVVLEQARRAEAYVWLAQIQIRRGPDWSAAQEALEHALEINPELVQIHMNLGKMFREQARLPSAKHAGRIFAMAAAFFAQSIRLAGENEEAEAERTSAEQMAARRFVHGEAPGSALDFAVRGCVYARRDYVENAEADLAQGLQALGTDAGFTDRTRIQHYLHKYALLLLAELAERLGRPEQSARLYRRVLETLDPDHPLALEKTGSRRE